MEMGGGRPKADRADRGLAERGVHRRCVHSMQESDHDQVGWQTCGRLCQQNQAVGWIDQVQGRLAGEAHETGFRHRVS